MTITNKLRLSFSIFIISLLIPVFVGVKAISAIREYQQTMLDISDLSFTQMRMATTVGEVMSIHEVSALEKHLAHVKELQQQFAIDLKPLKQLKMLAFKEYLQTIDEDEQALEALANQLFKVRRDFLTSNIELQQILAEHHDVPKGFLDLIDKANDKSIVEALVLINQKSSYALYNGMKEADVNVWLEALAALRERLLHNPNLASHKAIISTEMEERRKFVLTMVDTSRRHNHFGEEEDRLMLQFVTTVERNIQHGKHAKRQLLTTIEATAEQTAIIKGAVVAFMLFIAVLISMYLTRSITNSVSNMKRAVAKVSGGNLDYVMEESGKNEFSTLADAFNQMTVELKQARHDMSQHSLQLEQKISERTVELKQAVNKVEQNNRELEKLSAQLSKYLSPQIFQSIFSGKQEVALDTSRKKLTVFFSDIQGFTQLTDTMDPEAMTMVLNVYLNAMTEIALRHGGTIDKFIGDAVMVFFGDPESKGDKEDALACVNMALAMQAKMAQLKEYWQSQGYKLPFHIRMGINTGYCTVGNFGAENRMDYTIIGGNVNLASRLESNAKADQILISHTTQQLVEAQIDCEQLAEITVKGIATPVQTYAVTGRKATEESQTHIQRQQPGLGIDLDLTKIDKQQAKAALKDLLDQLD